MFVQLTNTEIRINPARILYIMQDVVYLEGDREVDIGTEDIARFSNLVELTENSDDDVPYWVNPDSVTFIEGNSVFLSDGTELEVKSIDPLVR